MIKKIPWKNIVIIFATMLIIPVSAIAMTTKANPNDDTNDTNSNIQITSGENNPDAASSATALLTAGALGYLDAATSATVVNQNNQSGGADAISSATGKTGTTGSLGYDNDYYDDDEDEDDDEFDDEDDD